MYSAMSLIEMSQQHRTTPARATFAIGLNTNNEDVINSSSDRLSSDQVDSAGDGVKPSTEYVTPTRRCCNYTYTNTYCVHFSWTG